MSESVHNSNSRLSHNIRENQEKKASERKRNILYLIRSFLLEHNLENSAQTLTSEANLSDTCEVCDNIDLDTILQEYVSYYNAKFGKIPKICKTVSTPTEVADRKKTAKPHTKVETKTLKNQHIPAPNILKKDEFKISIKKLGENQSNSDQIDLDPEEDYYIKPIAYMQSYSQEWKEMAQIVTREIIPKNLGIKWKDCIGLETIINLLNEAIVYPISFPELFADISPWKGVMLYGPPGTGKTMIAKALACETKTVFINVTASTFISKWRGDSEKLVRVLFDVARFYAPCTIFIDELDALASRRDEQQHEASRRFKSELLTQMDGIMQSSDQIFILGTTNLPWEVDPAILRRFDKKILIDLPNKDSRIKIFKKHLNAEIDSVLKSCDLEKFSAMTENYSGSDIRLVCKSAIMSCVRRKIEKIKESGDKKECGKKYCPTFQDVEFAISNSKPSSVYFRDKYLVWKEKFGGI